MCAADKALRKPAISGLIASPILPPLLFQLFGRLVIFLRHFQQRRNRPVIIEFKRQAAAMFGLQP